MYQRCQEETLAGRKLKPHWVLRRSDSAAISEVNSEIRRLKSSPTAAHREGANATLDAELPHRRMARHRVRIRNANRIFLDIVAHQ